MDTNNTFRLVAAILTSAKVRNDGYNGSAQHYVDEFHDMLILIEEHENTKRAKQHDSLGEAFKKAGVDVGF